MGTVRQNSAASARDFIRPLFLDDAMNVRAVWGSRTSVIAEYIGQHRREEDLASCIPSLTRSPASGNPCSKYSARPRATPRAPTLPANSAPKFATSGLMDP